MTFEELTGLRDPAKPYRRVYLCSDGTHVKVHAVLATGGFGAVRWRMTSSHCDSEGYALEHGDGYAVHVDAHDLVILSHAEKTAEEIAAEFDAAIETVVRRTHAAVLNEAFAASLMAVTP
jgi:hypothetical protein